MPRSLVVGNGNLLVNFDHGGMMRDFYFPFVGMEDHTTYGHLHRIGVFDENSKEFSWLNEDHWHSKNEYVAETLVGKTILKSDKWNLEILIENFVHPLENVICRRLHFKNNSEYERKLRVFFNFDFHLYGVKGNDTAFFNAEDNNLIFYKYNRYILIDGFSGENGIREYTTGKSEYRHLEGTWRDAEDGELSFNPIEQGSVDATIGMHTIVKGGEESLVEICLCVGQNMDEVKRLDRMVRKQTVVELLDYTMRYWKNWVNKQNFNYDGVDEKAVKLFKQSLLVMRTQIDNHGAILAANDMDIMKFNKDTYSYMWARDAALIAMSLDDTGYTEITKRFFEFLKKVQENEGYLMHKYNPDGSLGSSWHPWITKKGKADIPIQEDETALPLIALCNHYHRMRDIEFIQNMFSFIAKAGNFMVKHMDEKTGLPLPSYDLWEEKEAIFSFTCATTYRGLMSAAELSNILGHDRHAMKYGEAAKKVKDAILKYLYHEDEKTFVKSIKANDSGGYDYDLQADASVCGIFLFDVLDADDERVVNTMKRIKEKLSVKTDIGGIARYERDFYMRDGDYPGDIPGNPWIITTLWYSQWLMAMAKDIDSDEFKEAEHWVKWAVERASDSFILPEQVNPFNGRPLSVAPLTWSHSTYIDTIMIYRQKLTDFGVCKECMLPEFNV